MPVNFQKSTKLDLTNYNKHEQFNILFATSEEALTFSLFWTPGAWPPDDSGPLCWHSACHSGTWSYTRRCWNNQISNTIKFLPIYDNILLRHLKCLHKLTFIDSFFRVQLDWSLQFPTFLYHCRSLSHYITTVPYLPRPDGFLESPVAVTCLRIDSPSCHCCGLHSHLLTSTLRFILKFTKQGLICSHLHVYTSNNSKYPDYYFFTVLFIIFLICF